MSTGKKLRISGPEAAEYLGIPERRLKDWRKLRIVPYYKIGGKCIYAVADLDAVLEKGYVPAIGIVRAQ